MINELIKLANALDDAGFEKEADQIDLLIKSSSVPVVAPSILQALPVKDENGCINWDAWNVDPWALADNILKKMKEVLGPKGYLDSLDSYKKLMSEAGLESGIFKSLGLINDFTTFMSQKDIADIEKIRVEDQGIASATYKGNGTLSGRQLHVGLHKDFFTSYCTKSVGELAVIIGHELSHHILDSVKKYSDIAKKLNPETEKLRDDKGGFGLINSDGEALAADTVDLSIEMSSWETQADILGKYLAEKAGYPDGDVGEWLRRNTEDASSSRRIDIGDDLVLNQTHPSSWARGNPELWDMDEGGDND